MQRDSRRVFTRGLLAAMVVLWTAVAYERVGSAQAPAASGAARTLASANAPAATQQPDQQALIDRGRQAVAQTCTGCHNGILRIVQMHGKSADEWRNTVYSMIGRGAQILPEEIEPLAVFLASVAPPRSSRPAAPPASSPPPAAAGAPADAKAILDRECQQCHDLALATSKPAIGDWKAAITRMVSYGARLTTAEHETLLKYLEGPSAAR